MVPTRVLTPEFLIAAALNVHRSKDYERVFRLLTEAKVDRALVNQLVDRFALKESWGVFIRRYPEFA